MPDTDVIEGTAVEVTESMAMVLKDRTSSPARLDSGTATATYTWDGKVPIQNARVLKHWARSSEWIRGGINIRKSQVSSAEWDIVPFDQRKLYSKRLQEKVRAIFRRPNPANDSFRSFIEPIIEDLIALDAGTVEKVRNPMGQLLELWPVNAEWCRVNALWDGDPNSARYYWYPGGSLEKGRWKNEDFIWMMLNPRTDSPVGLSPLETLRGTISAELAAHEYNRRQVENAAPDGIINLGEGFTEPMVMRFREFFESEVAGRGPLGFIGGTKDPGFIKFRDSNRDQQFLEWQIYLVRKIAVVLGLTPQDLGVTFDINRSTAETQVQISEDRGLRPLMSAIQEYLTREVVWDPSFEGSGNNLAFRFTALNLKESTAKANIYHQALAGVPWRYINEARIDEGREPIKEMEGKLIMATPQGAVDISDVPTVRELMEAANAAKQQSASSAKSMDDMVSAFAEIVERKFAEARPDSDLSKVAEMIVPLIQDHMNQDHELAQAGLENLSKIVSGSTSRPIEVDATTTISEGAIQAKVFTEGSQNFEEGAVRYEQHPDVLVEPAPVVVDMAPLAASMEKIQRLLESPPPAPVTVESTEAIRDDLGRITDVIKHMSDGTVVHQKVQRDTAGRILRVEPVKGKE